MGIFSAAMAFIKGLSWVSKLAGLSKYVTPAIAGWQLAKGYVLKYWKISLILALAGTLVYVVWDKNGDIRGLNARITQLQTDAEAVDGVVERNRREYLHCLAVNRANALDLAAVRFEAEQARMKIEALNVQRNEQVEVISNEAMELRGLDVDCRKLDDPLPDWFDEWLRSGAANGNGVSDGNSYERPFRSHSARTYHSG